MSRPSRLSRLFLPMILLVLASTSTGCERQLRVLGSEPLTKRPAFEAMALQRHQYRVWVLVPRLKVHTYPMKGSRQQPMLQFTGDQRLLERGRGQVSVLVAPDRYRDGESVTFFEDKILWSDRLAPQDPRHFVLWLRENNRSAPTALDQQLKQVELVAQAIEEITGVAGFKVPARRAVQLSAQNIKRLERDWLILRWRCPWAHVLEAAKRRLQQDGQTATMLRTRLVASERHRGKPVAELTVLFIIQRLDRPLPREVSGKYPENKPAGK